MGTTLLVQRSHHRPPLYHSLLKYRGSTFTDWPARFRFLMNAQLDDALHEELL